MIMKQSLVDQVRAVIGPTGYATLAIRSDFVAVDWQCGPDAEWRTGEAVDPEAAMRLILEREKSDPQRRGLRRASLGACKPSQSS